MAPKLKTKPNWLENILKREIELPTPNALLNIRILSQEIGSSLKNKSSIHLRDKISVLNEISSPETWGQYFNAAFDKLEIKGNTLLEKFNTYCSENIVYNDNVKSLHIDNEDELVVGLTSIKHLILDDLENHYYKQDVIKLLENKELSKENIKLLITNLTEKLTFYIKEDDINIFRYSGLNNNSVLLQFRLLNLLKKIKTSGNEGISISDLYGDLKFEEIELFIKTFPPTIKKEEKLSKNKQGFLSFKELYNDGILNDEDIDLALKKVKDPMEIVSWFNSQDRNIKTRLKNILIKGILSVWNSVYAPDETLIKYFQLYKAITNTNTSPDIKIDGKLTEALKTEILKFRKEHKGEYWKYREQPQNKEKRAEAEKLKELNKDIKKILQKIFYFLSFNLAKDPNNTSLVLVYNELVNHITFIGEEIDLDNDGTIQLEELKIIFQEINNGLETKEDKDTLDKFLNLFKDQADISDNLEYGFVSSTPEGNMVIYSNIYRIKATPSNEADKTDILNTYAKYFGKGLNNETATYIVINQIKTFFNDKSNLNGLKELTENPNLDIERLSAKEAALLAVYMSNELITYDYKIGIGTFPFSEYYFEKGKDAMNNKDKEMYIKGLTKTLIASMSGVHMYDNKNKKFDGNVKTIVEEVLKYHKKISKNNNQTLLSSFKKYVYSTYGIINTDDINRGYFNSNAEFSKKYGKNDIGANIILGRGEGVCRQYAFSSQEIYKALFHIGDNKKRLKNSTLLTLGTSSDIEYSSIRNHAYNIFALVDNDGVIHASQLDFQGTFGLDYTYERLLQALKKHSKYFYDDNIILEHFKILGMQNNVPKKVMKELLNKYLDILAKKAKKSPEIYEKISLVLGSLPFEEYKDIKKMYIDYFMQTLKGRNKTRSMSLSIEVLGDVKDSLEGTILKASLLTANNDLGGGYYHMTQNNEATAILKEYVKIRHKEEKKILELEKEEAKCKFSHGQQCNKDINNEKDKFLNIILPNNAEVTNNNLALKKLLNTFLNNIYIYLYSRQSTRNDKQIPFEYILLNKNYELIPEYINTEVMASSFKRNGDKLIKAIKDSNEYSKDKDVIALLLCAYILNSDDKAVSELLDKDTKGVKDFILLVQSTKDNDLFEKLKNNKWNSIDMAYVITGYGIKNLISNKIK